jgi:hypothetical protein
MRTCFLTLVTLAMGTAAVQAQQGWAEKMFADGPKTKPVLTHDFGTIAKGTQLKHTFKITNIYAVRMEITGIKSGCGCVTATAAKRVLEPRESTTLEVTMDGRRFSGPKTVPVRVTVGPEYISTAELKISAVSRADVVFNPGEINFGNVIQGQTPTQTIDVEYAGVLNWEVSEVVTRDVPYTATIKQLYRRTGQVGYRIAVTLKADAPAGALKHTLYLKTNDQASPLVPVLVESNVQSALSVAPSALSLGTVNTGVALTRRVVVRGGKAFRVTGVEGLGEGVELGAALTADEAEVHFVTFQCNFERPGPFRRELKIKTSLQDAPVSVLIEGTAAGK